MATDGSNMAPGLDGNTNIQSPPAKKRDAERKHWILTIKSTDGSNGSIFSWVKQHCDAAIWQIEKGDTTGYEHIQITLTMKKKCRLSWIKNHFSKTAHIEIVRNIDASFDYCQKSETRIAGPYYYPEPIQKVKDPLEGKEMYEYQKEILEIIKKDPDDRKIYWYWDEDGNVGKSSFCKHLVLKYDAQYALGKKADIYHAINENVKILVIDIPRTCQEFTPYEVIESIKNGLIFSGKYESKVKVFNPPHVIVFANFPPDKSKMSRDRWMVNEIDITV